MDETSRKGDEIKGPLAICLLFRSAVRAEQLGSVTLHDTAGENNRGNQGMMNFTVWLQGFINRMAEHREFKNFMAN